MASLTAQLQTEQQGQPIVNPQPYVAPSFMQGLAETATNVLQTFTQIQGTERENSARRAASDRQARMDKKAADEENALNEYAIDSTQTLINRDRELQTPDAPTIAPQTPLKELDPALGLPEDVTQGYSDLNRVKSAVAQKRRTPADYDMRHEALLSEMMAKHPGQAAAIAKFAESQGHTHFMYQAIKAHDDQVQSRDKSINEGDDAAYKAGVSTGATGSYEQIVALGHKTLAADFAFNEGKRQADAASADWHLKEEQRKANKSIADDQMSSASMTQLGLQVAPFQNALAAATNAAGDNPQDQATLDKTAEHIGTAFETSVTNQRQRMAAAGVTDFSAFDKTVENYRQTLTNMRTGPLSYRQTTQRTLDNIKTQFGIDDSSAMQLYGGYSRMFGRDAINAYLGPNGVADVLDPALKAKLKAEIKGFHLADHDSGQAHLLRVKSILDGNGSLATMNEDEARKVIGTVTTMTSGNAHLVASGGAPDDIKNNYLNGVETIASAAVGIAPNTHDVNSVAKVMSSIATPDHIAAQVALLNDPVLGERARQDLAASRDAVAHTLEVAKTVQLPGHNPLQEITYDHNRQIFRVQVNEQAFRNQVATVNAKTGYQTNKTFTKQEILAHVDPNILKKVNALNAGVSYLAGTAPHDDNIPKNASLRSLRDHYATGSKLTDANGQVVKKAPDSAHERFVAANRELQTQADKVTTSLITDPATRIQNPGGVIPESEAIGHFNAGGYNRAASSGITGALLGESPLDTGAVGDSGLARSIGQWHSDRVKLAEKNGFDISSKSGALGFVTWELEHGDAQAREAGRQLKLIPDTPEGARQAAKIFTNLFERPRAETAHLDERMRHAERLYGAG